MAMTGNLYPSALSRLINSRAVPSGNRFAVTMTAPGGSFAASTFPISMLFLRFRFSLYAISWPALSIGILKAL